MSSRRPARHGRAVSRHRVAGAQARDAGIGVTLDAEEAERLELSLLLVDKLLASDVTRGYAGFGLAVQAYQKRAYATSNG
jgi:RHH-type proline utilization regulon transcriptional repressor/proline dehydrogenase/delta 1-pyrroline-5-carboxylate dehydrogenase